MRKITGYIGALIIVFALMGSILMGYALNVNGNSTIANEYDYITDVSGLYSHSQEPSYIDYNPASNYIGYQSDAVDYESDAGSYYMKKVTSTATYAVSVATGNYSFDGKNGVMPMFGVPVFLSLGLAVEWNIGTVIVRGTFNATYTDGWVTLTVDGPTVKIYKNDVLQSTLTINSLKVIYSGDSENFDYYGINGRNNVNGTGDNNDYYAYINSIDDIVSYDLVTPRIGDTANTAPINTWGNKWLGENRVTNTINNGSMTAPAMFTDYTEMGSGIYRVNANFADYVTNQLGQPVVNRTISGYYIAYPASVQPNSLGIDYTESNRVNNYPMEADYDNTRSTISASVDLLAVSSADYMTNKPALIASQTFTNSPVYSYLSYQGLMFKVNSYKLSDIFSTLATPAGTNSVRIDAPTVTQEYGYLWAGASGSDVMYFTGLNGNWAVLAPFGNVAQGELLDFSGMANNYIYYYPDSGKCDLYNGAGVKLGTYGGLDQLFIIFADPTGGNDVKIDFRYRVNNQTDTAYDNLTVTKTRPFINLTYSTGGEITTVHYADITKGFSIKDNNIVNTVWDNQYLNGNIQLLFRADDTLATYSNDIIVGDNTISIDYTTNRFYVQLNGADPVDIGTWRNILLNIDLRNGELSAIPVRTFNSYTNVVLDNTSIFIGELVNPAPTNIIEWAPTTNSLMFNVYSTSVFMDTYGVVMVNPTLNITDYFTDLNNFYRLRLFNFSVLGSTITINGVTYDVTNDTITINEQTIQVKNMAITYADGHAYISDSNADIDLGEITDNNVSMAGAWYFETDLYRGYTTQKMVYEWNWGDFILNNTQFCIMYMGLALVGLIVARHYCNMSITDYIVLILSFVIALTVQVVA